MLFLLLTFAACADGAPTEDVSILEIDAAHMEDPDAPSPEDVLDADVIVLSEIPGEFAGEDDIPALLTLEAPPELISVDPALIRPLIPPRPLVRLADEIAAATSVLFSVLAILGLLYRKVWPILLDVREYISGLPQLAGMRKIIEEMDETIVSQRSRIDALEMDNQRLRANPQPEPTPKPATPHPSLPGSEDYGKRGGSLWIHGQG